MSVAQEGERDLFPLWLWYVREEHARPPIVEAFDAAMQLVVTSYADELADNLDEDPAIERFLAMRQAVVDRAKAEDRCLTFARDLELAERVLRLIRAAL